MRCRSFCNLFDRLGPGLLAATVAATTGILDGCGFSQLTRVSSEHFPQAQACGHCHVDIYNEWKQSPHAGAFENTRFRAGTDGYRFEQCLGCHAPEPVLAGGEPKARAIEREAGVTCVSCHFQAGAMVGPLPPTGLGKPHPIKVDPASFEDGRLCGQCHQGTLAQWRAAGQQQAGDCRDCHMPPIRRKTTQATQTHNPISKLFVAAERPAEEHRHSFAMVPIGLPGDPIALDIHRDGSRAVITLTNRLPHNLPTGDFGVRIVEIGIEAIDAQGAVSAVSQWDLTSAAGGFLESGQSRQWFATIPSNARRLRVTVTRVGRDGANRARLLEREVALP